MSNFKYDADEIKNNMRGNWVDFLSQCAGFEARVFNKKHQPCPLCGGKDRFRFDDNLEHRGDGGYICGQCGSGSGMKLYLEATQVGFGVALDDCAKFLNMQPIERKTYNKKMSHVVLPMKQDPHLEAEVFYNSCESMGDIKIINGAQVVRVTDTSSKMVSCALLSGQGQEVRHFNKKLLWGSCVIFGKLDGKVILTTDYYQANRINKLKGINAVCYFDTFNLMFIYRELSKLAINMILICHDEQDWLQAERCRFKEARDSKGQVLSVKTMCDFITGFECKIN
jgi:hypothetical protein